MPHDSELLITQSLAARWPCDVWRPTPTFSTAVPLPRPAEERTMPSLHAHAHARARATVLVLATLLLAAQVAAQAPYFPAAGDAGQRRPPEQVGLNAQAVKDAVALAVAAEATTPRALLEKIGRGH